MKQSFFSISLLLITYASISQQELSLVQDRLAAYTKAQLPEKIFIHTDKNFYTAGEIVWFKVYVVDGIFHKILPTSKVAYVELLDKTNAPILRAKIKLSDSGGDGSFQLPFSLPSGHYTIRSYTTWMKNFGSANFFQETLAVVNTLKSPDESIEKHVAAYSLKLFPEGGNLVSGLTSKIAFHLTDQFGKGAQGTGYLLNDKNDTLSTFAPYKFGMGHFMLRPEKETAYKVVFKLNDGKIVTEMVPRGLESGYTMQVRDTADNKVSIIVQTNIRSSFTAIYLLAQTRQIVKAVQKSLVNEGICVFVLDKNVLGDGISQFTIFDNEKKPVCERLFYLQPKLQNEISLQLVREKYTTRERVELSVTKLSNGENTMSLSVYQLDSLQDVQGLRINEYFWLTSELHGTVEQPSFYFSALSEGQKLATDYLMLTHGWRRFKWQTVLQRPLIPTFKREEFGHIITGKVTDIRTNTVAKGIQVFLSVPTSTQKLFAAISDSTGLVHFDVKDYFGKGEIIVQTNSQKDSFYKVEIQSPFADASPDLPPTRLNFLPAQETALRSRSLSMQAQHIYTSELIDRHSKPHVSDTLPFYGQPLYSYNLDEYVRFNTMEEVLREYVREISVGVKGSGNSLRFKLFNEHNREHYTDDILVMSDGIPMFNANKVFSIDPLKIKQLDIINRNYVFGDNIFHGLANFISYDFSTKGLELDPKAFVIDYEGIQLQREFYSPNYSSETQRNSRIPDLRHTLLWVADVKTTNVSFFTGDNKGRYLIVLQGIDANGKPFSTSSQIDVQ